MFRRKGINLNCTKFLTFLESIGVKEQFAQYLYFNKATTIKLYFKNSDPEYLFLDAFIWKQTEQGTSFWNDIDNQYQELIKGN